MNSYWLISLCLPMTGGLAIFAHYSAKRWLQLVFKPLTTILILLLAWSAPGEGSYKTLILAGLFFSLWGDIFLMWPERLFIAGLASFLIGHIAYMAAFWPAAEAIWWLLAPIGLYMFFFLRWLWPHISSIRFAVLAYAIAISGMLWLAAGQASAWQNSAGLAALIGALFFAISDSILAGNKFAKPWYGAQLNILWTYYLAQWLIASSLWW